VDHANTATEGLKLFSEKEFDVLVSDLGLPDESGLELMRKLSVLRPGIRGICMSGYGMEGDVADSRAAGFMEHLTKPIDLARLKTAIAKAASEFSDPGKA
jgi:CheY-like chemotaxis protein